MYYYFNATIGINSIQYIDTNILVYPNPANNQLIIKTNTGIKQIIYLYDIYGKLILSKEVFNLTDIDVGNLSVGAYILKIKNKNNIIARKVIISE